VQFDIILVTVFGDGGGRKTTTTTRTEVDQRHADVAWSRHDDSDGRH